MGVRNPVLKSPWEAGWVRPEAEVHDSLHDRLLIGHCSLPAPTTKMSVSDGIPAVWLISDYLVVTEVIVRGMWLNNGLSIAHII